MQERSRRRAVPETCAEPSQARLTITPWAIVPLARGLKIGNDAPSSCQIIWVLVLMWVGNPFHLLRSHFLQVMVLQKQSPTHLWTNIIPYFQEYTLPVLVVW